MSNLIDRQDAIEKLRVAYFDNNIQNAKDDPCIVDAITDWAIRQIKDLQSAEPVIRCKDCKWYDTTEEMTYGYCEAIKHSYYSRKWEINIHRTYPPDFYCADAEPKDEEEDESDE